MDRIENIKKMCTQVQILTLLVNRSLETNSLISGDRTVFTNKHLKKV